MELLNLQKTHLPGKSLLLIISLLLSLIVLPVKAQSTACTSDFKFEIDHQNKEVSLKARSSHQPAVFGWKISDGSAYRGQSIDHTFSAAGTYKICLLTIAFDSSANRRCTSNVCKTVTIADCDRLEAKFDYVVDGLSVKVRGTSNSSNAVYGYSFGDGTSQRGQSASHTYSSRGVYAICFYAKDTIYGCKTEVCKKVLIDPCTIRAKFDYRQSGNDFKFFAKANDSNARYVWDFGDGTRGSGDEIKHSYQRPGVYVVCLKVLSKSGTVLCDYKVCERVEVPNRGCDLEAKFEFRQDGRDFKFYAKSNQDPSRFVWDFGDGNSAYGDEVKHRYDSSGIYEVCLTVYSKGTTANQICTTKVCKRVKIDRPNDPCNLNADFTIRIDGNKIAVHARSNQDSVLYFWSFGDMKDGKGKTAKHKYSEYGKYEICLIVFNPRTKCKTCICKTIVIEKPCKLKAEFKVSVTKNIAYFKARSNGSNQTEYYWDFGDGSRGKGEATRHQYAKRGVYQVTLVIYDPRTDCKIRVQRKVYIGVRPHQVALDETMNRSSTDEEKPRELKLDWKASVNPSPARSTVAFSSDDKELETVKIFSSDGSLALEIKSNLQEVNIDQLPKGFYYAHVYATDGTLTIVKFLKE